MNGLKALAAKQRNDILASMVSGYLRIKFHENSGGVAAYNGKVSGAAISGNYTVGGTTTNIFSTRGYIKPGGGAGSGNNFIGVVNQSLDALLRLDNLSGGLLVLARFKFLAAYTDINGYLLQYNGANGARWEFTINGNANLQLHAQVHDGTTLRTAAWVGSGKTAATDYAFMAYYDVANNLIYAAANGNWPGAVSQDISASLKLPDTTVASKGFTFFANTGAGPSYVTPFNGNAADDGCVSDLWIVRKVGGFTAAQLAAICTEYNQRPLAIPLTFEGQ